MVKVFFYRFCPTRSRRYNDVYDWYFYSYGNASGGCDQHRDPARLGNDKVPLRTWIVLVLPTPVCSLCTARRLQPHMAADRDLWIAVRRRIQKTVKYVYKLSGGR